METKDLIVIGGGINGTGIAADAAGRGLSVLLLEAQDLACATSSASSKLIHGGLRYLEHYEFRLVNEALAEREVLLKMAPHIVFPIRFRLPHRSHLRPAWMIRLGLFMYDHLGKRTSLPASESIRFGTDSILKPEIVRGFEYSDCWVDDARLVVLNAQEVVAQGGDVKTRTQVTRAWRENGLWHVEARDSLTGENHRWQAKGLANATGPWVKHFIDDSLHLTSQYSIRLIKGSHIVVPRVYPQPQAYVLQNEDHRIVFVIPWVETFSIIGTTDVEYHGDPGEVYIDNSEIDYLLKAYNAHFKQPIGRDDIIWTYSGVRPLCDDESDSPQAVTRDYRLSLSDEDGKAPLLSVFGGKLTTYRKLAEHALEKLVNYYPHAKGAWTRNVVLPGGNFSGTRDDYAAVLRLKFSFLPEALARRYSHTYGTRSEQLLAGTAGLADLGEYFGHGLYEAELRYLVAQEWVVTLDDAIWRRTKLGMWLDEAQQARITNWLAQLQVKTSLSRFPRHTCGSPGQRRNNPCWQYSTPRHAPILSGANTSSPPHSGYRHGCDNLLVADNDSQVN